MRRDAWSNTQFLLKGKIKISSIGGALPYCVEIAREMSFSVRGDSGLRRLPLWGEITQSHEGDLPDEAGQEF
jgi:hypothetical protein